MVMVVMPTAMVSAMPAVMPAAVMTAMMTAMPGERKTSCQDNRQANKCFLHSLPLSLLLFTFQFGNVNDFTTEGVTDETLRTKIIVLPSGTLTFTVSTPHFTHTTPFAGRGTSSM